VCSSIVYLAFGVAKQSYLAETLHPRLSVICQRRDAVLRLPQIRITGPALALCGACGYATAESPMQDGVSALSGSTNVIREKKFPKRPRAQIEFLANSLAGLPSVEPRTSRDICAKHLAEQKAKSPHKILRKEFYVECSCGYKGPALNDACRKCGAQISFLPGLLHGIGLFLRYSLATQRNLRTLH